MTTAAQQLIELSAGTVAYDVTLDRPAELARLIGEFAAPVSPPAPA
ncbi:hypothetical protein [Streptomyces xylophagus]|nr:hypothetical protein [Streptomyces xylophagus]